MPGSAVPTCVSPDVLVMGAVFSRSEDGDSPGACAPAHAPGPGRSAAHDVRAGRGPPAVQIVEDRLQRLTGLPARGVNDPLAVGGLAQADLGSTVDGFELALVAGFCRELLDELDTSGIEVGQVVREAAVLQRRDAALGVGEAGVVHEPLDPGPSGFLGVGVHADAEVVVAADGGVEHAVGLCRERHVADDVAACLLYTSDAADE